MWDSFFGLLPHGCATLGTSFRMFPRSSDGVSLQGKTHLRDTCCECVIEIRPWDMSGSFN